MEDIKDVIEQIKDELSSMTYEGQLHKLIEIRFWIESQIEIAKLELEWRKDASARRGSI